MSFLDIAKVAGNALERELRKKYGNDRTQFIECDVTEDEQLFGAFDKVVKERNYIDIVINNAGIMNDSIEMYKKCIAVNIVSFMKFFGIYFGTIRAPMSV